MTSLLDVPLISEMDEIERKAKSGSVHALEAVLATKPPIVQAAVKRFQERDGMPLREAMKKAGIGIVCIR